MAGAMRKMAVYLGLVEDDRYEDDYYYDEGGRDSGRDSERIGSARSDRYADRDDRDNRDTVRVTESARTTERDDDLARRLGADEGQQGGEPCTRVATTTLVALAKSSAAAIP